MTEPNRNSCDETCSNGKVWSTAPVLVSSGGSGTPVYRSGSSTACTYTLSGKRVFFELSLALTSRGTLPPGRVEIFHNIPFDAVSNTGPQATLAVGPTFGLNASINAPLSATMFPQIALFKFYGGTSTNLFVVDLTDGFSILLSGHYHF